MAMDERSMRVGFLYLASLIGLGALMWGLVVGGVGLLHWAKPNTGAKAAPAVSQVQPTPTGTGTGAGQRGGNRANRGNGRRRTGQQTTAQIAAERKLIVDDAKSDVVKGAIAVVAGGLVLLVGTRKAKRETGVSARAGAAAFAASMREKPDAPAAASGTVTDVIAPSGEDPETP